jgi:hypothetical protein
MKKLKINLVKKIQTLVGISMVLLLCSPVLFASQSEKTWLDELSVSDGSKKLTELGYKKSNHMTETEHIQWAKKQIYWADGSGY